MKYTKEEYQEFLRNQGSEYYRNFMVEAMTPSMLLVGGKEGITEKYFKALSAVALWWLGNSAFADLDDFDDQTKHLYDEILENAVSFLDVPMDYIRKFGEY